jgi:hypothetical protein
MAIWKKLNKTIINSDMVKIVVASYYRFKMRYFYTCTEYENMDVCACNGKYLTEIEVKISYSDLKADAKKTKAYGKLKHDFYSGKNNSKYVLVPNYFYYCITEEMYDDGKSLKWIKENYPNYGIMWVKDWREPIITKRPTMLNKNKVGENILNSILMRISSENIGLRKKLYELKLSIKKEK